MQFRSYSHRDIQVRFPVTWQPGGWATRVGNEIHTSTTLVSCSPHNLQNEQKIKPFHYLWVKEKCSTLCCVLCHCITMPNDSNSGDITKQRKSSWHRGLSGNILILRHLCMEWEKDGNSSGTKSTLCHTPYKKMS